jgi:hypothetical protein
MKAKGLFISAMLVSMALAGCLDGGERVSDPYEDVTVTMATPEVNYREVATGTVWDATIKIMNVTPEHVRVWWEDVKIKVVSTEGTPLMDKTRPFKDPGSYTTTTECWYFEIASDVATMNAGDELRITTMSDSYEGGTLLLLANEEIICDELALPTDFPSPPRTVANLAAPQVSEKSDNATRWNIRIDINKITPKDRKVLWTEVKIIVKSSIGGVLDAATDLVADTGGPYANTTAFYYVETTSGDNKMSAGDGIKLTGLSSSYEGAIVELTKGGERFASATLPTNFP